MGFSEIILLGIIALIFIGPKQLPEVARTVGRMLNEWKRATSDFQNSMTDSFREDMRDRWGERGREEERIAELPPHDPMPADPNSTEKKS